MTLTHWRNQHAVGQGFFHSGALEYEGSWFRYIYDCGAMPAFTKQRSARIATYRKEVRSGRLDLLFISHAHADHLNGIEQLLAPGLQVDTIVMPLLDDIDRLLAFSRDVVEHPATSQHAFHRDFIIDPVSALGRFNPRQVLLVRRGGAGAPGSDGEGLEPPDGGRPVGAETTGESLGWKLVGRGAVDRTRAQPAGGATAADVVQIEDTHGILVAGLPFSWLLAPYVDRAVAEGRDRFARALVAALAKAGKHALAAKVGSLGVAELQLIVTEHVDALVAAYSALAKDLNVTSMSLYSGPATDSLPPAMVHECLVGVWRSLQVESRVAWLGTGDAALKQTKRRRAFLHHFGRLLRQVATMTLPHHGSANNFHSELLTHVPAKFLVAAADHYSDWNHPSSSVVKEVASAGRFVSVVTSDQNSRFLETVTVPS